MWECCEGNRGRLGLRWMADKESSLESLSRKWLWSQKDDPEVPVCRSWETNWSRSSLSAK